MERIYISIDDEINATAEQITESVTNWISMNDIKKEDIITLYWVIVGEIEFDNLKMVTHDAIIAISEYYGIELHDIEWTYADVDTENEGNVQLVVMYNSSNTDTFELSTLVIEI